MPEAPRAPPRARGGHDDVEHHVGLGLVEHGVEVRADSDTIELEFARPLPGPVGVEIDEADDRQCRRSRLAASSHALLMAPQPTRTTLIIPVLLPREPFQAAVTEFRNRFSVNVYDNTPDGVECQSAFCRLWVAKIK